MFSSVQVTFVLQCELLVSWSEVFRWYLSVRSHLASTQNLSFAPSCKIIFVRFRNETRTHIILHMQARPNAQGLAGCTVHLYSHIYTHTENVYAQSCKRDRNGALGLLDGETRMQRDAATCTWSTRCGTHSLSMGHSHSLEWEGNLAAVLNPANWWRNRRPTYSPLSLLLYRILIPPDSLSFHSAFSFSSPFHRFHLTFIITFSLHFDHI